MVDQHGAFCSHRFMDGGSSGLSDREMMTAHQLWDALGPALQGDTVWMGAADLTGTVIERADGTAEDNGQMRSGDTENGPGDAGEMAEPTGGKEKHPERADGRGR